MKGYLHAILGTDLREVDGLEENTVLTIIAITGTNMEKWPTAAHFASWLNLAARPRISGGKVLGHEKRKAIIQRARLSEWRPNACGKTKVRWGRSTGGSLPAKAVRKQSRQSPDGLLLSFIQW